MSEKLPPCVFETYLSHTASVKCNAKLRFLGKYADRKEAMQAVQRATTKTSCHCLQSYYYGP
jgi:hypothetical protein